MSLSHINYLVLIIKYCIMANNVEDSVLVKIIMIADSKSRNEQR